MKVVQGIHLRTNLVSYPNPNLLVAISKGMQIVKLCCNKIPRVLTGVLAYNVIKWCVFIYTNMCLYTQTIVAYVWYHAKCSKTTTA